MISWPSYNIAVMRGHLNFLLMEASLSFSIFFHAADIFSNLLEIYMAYVNPYGRLIWKIVVKHDGVKYFQMNRNLHGPW